MNMLNGRIYTYDNHKSLGQRLLGALAFLLIISLCLYLFYQIYKFLFYLTPIFILVALFIYPKIVGDHFKMLAASFKQNFLAGFLELGLQIIGLPIVSIGLLIKAWAYKKFGQVQETFQKSQDDQFTSFEEVKDNKVEFKEITKPEEKLSKANNGYDDLFE